MTNETKPTVNITITTDTETAEAVLSAVEELVEDEDINVGGIKR